MSLKLLIFLTTSALLVYGNDVERKDNAESYITKEAAKELNKLNARGKQQDLAYDEILEQFLSVQQSGDDEDEERTFEKKYFDYLPNDLDSEDVADEDATRELLKPENARVENERRVNSRRLKRDLSAQNRPKRQKFAHFAPIQSRFDSPIPNSNPWHPDNNPGKLHPPSNFYLPARPGNNNPQPPHNPMKDPMEIVDRVAGFEGPDEQPIWSSNNIRRPNTISPERRPQTTKQPPYDENSIDFHNGNGGDVDIEYPPDIFDPNVKLTTRAPLTRPTRDQKRTSNSNRQNKPVTTSPSPPTTTTTRQSNRTSNSRKQNTTLPACVLAIVNCCSRYDETVRQPCFERYKCNAAFFGQKACSADIKASAFREVERFSQK